MKNSGKEREKTGFVLLLIRYLDPKPAYELHQFRTSLAHFWHLSMVRNGFREENSSEIV